jgi:hypothetical protein
MSLGCFQKHRSCACQNPYVFIGKIDMVKIQICRTSNSTSTSASADIGGSTRTSIAISIGTSACASISTSTSTRIGTRTSTSTSTRTLLAFALVLALVPIFFPECQESVWVYSVDVLTLRRRDVDRLLWTCPHSHAKVNLDQVP